MADKAVILVSGGLDSSTLLADLDNKGFEIYVISFNYCQNNVVELQKIKKFIKNYNVVRHQIIDIDLSIFDISALVNDKLEIPKYGSKEQIGDNIPITYVPARNTLFLSYALGLAETVGANNIYIGAHASDAANYPDCRPEFIESFNQTANLATKSGVSDNKITAHAPFLDMTKADIVKKGLELKVDYSDTISCYNPTEDGKSCGKCLSCLVRLDAFKSNGISDPASYV